MTKFFLATLLLLFPVVAGAQPVVFVEVRNVADLGEFEAPSAAARRRPADFEIAEPGRKAAQLLVGDVLVVEDEHGMPVDRLPEGIDHRGVERVAQVDAADFGADMRMKRSDLK